MCIVWARYWLVCDGSVDTCEKTRCISMQAVDVPSLVCPLSPHLTPPPVTGQTRGGKHLTSHIRRHRYKQQTSHYADIWQTFAAFICSLGTINTLSRVNRSEWRHRPEWYSYLWLNPIAAPFVLRQSWWLEPDVCVVILWYSDKWLLWSPAGECQTRQWNCLSRRVALLPVQCRVSREFSAMLSVQCRMRSKVCVELEREGGYLDTVWCVMWRVSWHGLVCQVESMYLDIGWCVKWVSWHCLVCQVESILT